MKVKVQNLPILNLSWNKQSLPSDPHSANKTKMTLDWKQKSIKGGELGKKEKMVDQNEILYKKDSKAK